MKRFVFALAWVVLSAAALSAAEKKSVVLIAGKPSHGPGQHEHNAGVLLFKKCLEQGAADAVRVTHYLNSEWPSADVLAKADTILFYADGQGGHPALQADHLQQLGKEMARGCGLVCVHYAVEPTLEKGNKEFLDWLGGCFEIHYSVNPHWEANFKSLPEHPVSRAILGGDEAAFWKAEAAERRAAGVPPYGRMAGVILSSPDVAQVFDFAGELARRDGPLRRVGAVVFGPAPAPIARVRGRHRVRLLVKAEKGVPLQAALAEWVGQLKPPANLRLAVDIDPQSFL